MFEKIWSRHGVAEGPGGHVLLYIDRHLLHEGSTSAFGRLAKSGRAVRRPDLTFATADHYVLTSPGSPAPDAEVRSMVESPLPGITLVCGDSHTATHGAFGALAFGIGSTEVEHVMATQTLWQKKPKVLRITVEGRLPDGVNAKDVILAIIARIGAGGGVGHAVEYAGSTIRAMSMDERMTVCNMSIEAGARAGMVAPDETTFAYLQGRPFAPRGDAWGKALAYWETLPSDADAKFDREVELSANEIAPTVTWGTSPQDALPITGRVPDPAAIGDDARRESMERALAYMGLRPGTPLSEVTVDRVFIGSCTNSRLEDLRAAARVVKGRRAMVPAWIVPGSGLVKRAAEAEGLDRVFVEAGFEWREAGCSMCDAWPPPPTATSRGARARARART